MTHAPTIQRKLTTILSADAANYSGRMAQDEVGTIQALRKSRIIFENGITSRLGRIANTAGDGLIAEFPSVVEAVAAAVTIQQKLRAGPNMLPFHMGLHLGDVIVEGEDLPGDGVNLAARLQSMAQPGGIIVSQPVVDQAKRRLDAEFCPLGHMTPKHMPDDIAFYAVAADGLPAIPKIAAVAPKIHAKSPAKPSFNPEKLEKARNRLIVFGVGTVFGSNLMGPWLLIGMMPALIAFYFQWRKRLKYRDA